MPSNGPSIISSTRRSLSSFMSGANPLVETEAGPETTTDQADEEVNQLFLPYRGFSARKRMQLKEVVLEGADISKAIVDYINTNSIQNIVVGASNRSIMKKLRSVDVPSSLIKLAPDFCAVYVLSNGKPTSIRSARNSTPSTIPPRQLSITATSLYLPDQEDSVSRTSYSRRSWRVSGPPTPSHERTEKISIDMLPDYLNTSARERPLSTARSAPSNLFMDKLDSANQPRGSVDYGSSFSDDIDLQGLSFQSMNFGDSLEFSSVSMDSPGSTPSSLTAANRELEAEMRKLKLELKQTMEMYSNACKEVVTAKQKAMELQQWKFEEAQKFEELRHAEEAALAMAEMEKIKCRAAVEAAEAAQRIAELEAHKRQNAERKARREAREKKKAWDALAQTDTRYRRYTIDEIKDATNEFTAENKIGEGGYGPVYKAYLDHTPVAIKVLRTDAAQGRKQFQQELFYAIGRGDGG